MLRLNVKYIRLKFKRQEKRIDFNKNKYKEKNIVHGTMMEQYWFVVIILIISSSNKCLFWNILAKRMKKIEKLSWKKIVNIINRSINEKTWNSLKQLNF